MNRFLLKQFAGNARNNGIFGSAQQGAGVIASSLEQVQSLVAFESGWNSATMTADKLPCLEEFQGLQALLCKAIKELYSEGIPEWISTETYQLNSHCTYQGDIYHNITGAYTTNNPALDTTNWEKLSDRIKSQISSYFVDLTSAQTISGNKTFSGTSSFTGDVSLTSANLKTINSGSIIGTGDLGLADLSSAQTIGGTKTFSSVPKIATSTETTSTSTDSVNVAYLHNQGYATLQTYDATTSGYIIFSNGYCEQWGRGNFVGGTTLEENIHITLLKTYKNAGFNVVAQMSSGTDFARSMFYCYVASINTINVGYYDINGQTISTRSPYNFWWRTCGFLADGQY